MKVKDADTKNTKNELGRSHNISEQNDASDLYDRGQNFVNQREAKLNNLRQQRDNGLLDALGRAKSVPSDPIQKKVQPECPRNMPEDAENSSAADARI